MKKNICITGLLNDFSEHIAENLAKDLDVFFANVLKFVQFDIVDISNTIEVCGVDYYKKLISKKLKELSKYDDVIIFCNYYFYNYPECKSILKEKLITIYLDPGEIEFNKRLENEKISDLEAKIEKGSYKVRNKYFVKNCDILIDCSQKTEEQIVNIIKDKLIKYFSNKAGRKYENRK